MRILIFSDSHGSVSEMLNVCDREVFDLIIHLGDYSKDAASLCSNTAKPIISVAGNCDFMPKAPYELQTEISGVNVFLCHGNAFHGDANEIAAEAKKRNCSLAMFGHTHIPLDTVIDGVRVINPGSIGKPKYEHPRKSYGICSMENGKVSACRLLSYD